MFFLPVVLLNIGSEDNQLFMEKLFARYQRYIFFKAYCALRNFKDAEDVTSDTLVALEHHVDTLRDLHPKALKAYITRTTERKAWAFANKRKAGSFVNADIGDMNDVRSDDPDVDDGLIRQCNIVMLRNAMKLLRKPDSELLYMKYFDSLDTETIANILHVSAGTVRSKLSRARKRLYDIIKEQQSNE